MSEAISGADLPVFGMLAASSLRCPPASSPRTLCYGQRAPICYQEVAGPADPLHFRWPKDALVAQLDRAPDFESGGRGFESLRARQINQGLTGY